MYTTKMLPWSLHCPRYYEHVITSSSCCCLFKTLRGPRVSLCVLSQFCGVCITNKQKFPQVASFSGRYFSPLMFMGPVLCTIRRGNQKVYKGRTKGASSNLQLSAAGVFFYTRLNSRRSRKTKTWSLFHEYCDFDPVRYAHLGGRWVLYPLCGLVTCSLSVSIFTLPHSYKPLLWPLEGCPLSSDDAAHTICTRTKQDSPNYTPTSSVAPASLVQVTHMCKCTVELTKQSSSSELKFD